MHILWTRRQEKFFVPSRMKEFASATNVGGPSSLASLDRAVAMRTIQARFQSISNAYTVSMPVQRFEETISGRSYLIEVAAVTKDRWRAYIVRLPGVPTALMPFYGTTPADAAHQLCEWLTRAHARAANPTGPV